MAEKIFQQLIKNTSFNGIEVDSAGTAAMPYYAIVGDLKAVMDEKGVNYAGHIPQMIDEGVMKSSDVILVMTNSHSEEIIYKYPEYKDKVFLLSEYAEGVEKNIDDPIGMGKEAYRKSFSEIKMYLEKIVEKLKNEIKK